jgi:hypothetical protein
MTNFKLRFARLVGARVVSCEIIPPEDCVVRREYGLYGPLKREGCV